MEYYFSGKVSRVIFRGTSQSFFILKMLLDGESPEAGEYGDSLVVVKGYVPGVVISMGSWFGFQGKWVNDPKYGRQLRIFKAPVFRDYVDPTTVTNMLAANGISRMVAEQLKQVFGEQLSVALEDTEKIQKGLGVDSLQAEYISMRWQGIRQKMRVLEFLNELDLPQSKIGEIWAKFGDKTEEILAKNPWSLIRIRGLSFNQLDTLARRQGLDMKSIERREAAVLWAAREGRSYGHLFTTAKELFRGASKLLGRIRPPELVEALKRVCGEGGLVLDQGHSKAIYEPWFHHLESKCAGMLATRMFDLDFDYLGLGIPVPESPTDWGYDPFSDGYEDVGEDPFTECGDSDFPEDSSYEDSYEEKGSEALSQEEGLQEEIEGTASECGVVLSDEQTQGLSNAMKSRISILTGLPGTGKSTSMNVFVRMLRSRLIPFLMLAPTGIAAKRLSTVSNSPAFTVHRGLGAKGKGKDNARKATYAGIIESGGKLSGEGGEGEVWENCPVNPNPAEVIIVDEFSMVDQHLLYRILTGSAPDTKLLFVGDAAQLPSVGPGNVLRNLIQSECFPVTSLAKIFRQEEASDIIHAAHAIHAGKMPSLGGDFDLVQISGESRILAFLMQLAKRLYGNSKDWDKEGLPPSFQFLSPRHMGTLGVTNLNSSLRGLLNPEEKDKHEVKIGDMAVREGDRVMIVKNNYELGVFNGDIGKLMKINKRDKTLEVKIQDVKARYVTLNLHEAGNHLRLAYACTVHKYQGLEVDIVVMPLVLGFGRQLQRNLLYTAITRAKKKVILVGSRRALAKAVGNNKQDLRNTFFSERLQEEFEKAEGEVLREEECDA